MFDVKIRENNHKYQNSIRSYVTLFLLTFISFYIYHYLVEYHASLSVEYSGSGAILPVLENILSNVHS